MELPFVGRYAANAVLCFAFGKRRPIVDRNVIRIYERVFDTDLHYRSDETWQLAENVLPEENVQRFNLTLIDFAAQVCVARTPRCEVCLLTDICQYYASERA